MTTEFDDQSIFTEYQTKIKDCKTCTEKDQLIKDLISRGWDINEKNDVYESDENIVNPLESAIEHRNVENTKVLLDNGAKCDDVLDILFSGDKSPDDEVANIKTIIEMFPDLDLSVDEDTFNSIKEYDGTCLDEFICLVESFNDY